MVILILSDLIFYHGAKEVLGTKITIPDSPGKKRIACEKQKRKKGFKRRAAIEQKSAILNKINA